MLTLTGELEFPATAPKKAMTDQEKIKLLAIEVMKWRQENWRDEAMGGTTWVDDDGQSVAQCYYIYFEPIKLYVTAQDKVISASPGSTFEHDVKHGWNPFIHWDHAGMLVEKVQSSKRHWFLLYYMGPFADDNTAHWHVSIRYRLPEETRYHPFHFVKREASTAPAAICEAVLATMEQELAHISKVM